MATELQNKLVRENTQFIYLSELMVSQIYPKIVDALTKLGMEEVRFDEIKGFRNFAITLTGKIQFFDLDSEDKQKIKKLNLYDLNFLGEKQCPLFCQSTNTHTKEHESSFPKYKNYCETNALILKIENMGVSLNRKVMIEKNNNND